MTYGIVENGCCVNAIEAEAWYAESIGAIPLPAGYWIGDYYNGGWNHENRSQKPSPSASRSQTNNWNALKWDKLTPTLSLRS